MTATEELRQMLDERGVEYTQTIVTEGVLFTIVTSKEQYFILMRDNDAGIEMWSRDFTPEQAIAATLGSSNCTSSERTNDACKPTAYDTGYSIDRLEPGEYYEFWEPACACGNCGELIPMRKFCPNCGRRIEVDDG